LIGTHEDERAVSREGDVCVVNFARIREGEEAVEAVAREKAAGSDPREIPEERGEKGGEI